MRQSVRGGTVRLKGLSQSGQWPSGNPRYYLRRAGAKAVSMPDLPKSHPDFLAAYIAAMNGEAPANPAHRTAKTGTISAGILAYRKGDHYLTRAASTRSVWLRMLEDIDGRYGAARLADLAPRHIRQDLARLAPIPANNRLKVWRALGRWWVSAGLLEVNPTAGVESRDTPKSDGHAPWTRDDAQKYRGHWKIGTMQRLAMELMLHTGAGITDACRIGPGHVDRDGWLRYKRAKTGTLAICPFAAPATLSSPSWFEVSPHLADCIAASPRHMTFLSTAHGAARSPKAAQQWFSGAAKAAGLVPGKTAHGLRKLRSVMMTEAGASPEQRMAILGHETSEQTREYSKTADAKKIISGTDISNFSEQVGKNQN